MRKDVRQRLYSLRPQPLREVVSWIDELERDLDARLDALGEYLDRTHGGRG